MPQTAGSSQENWLTLMSDLKSFFFLASVDGALLEGCFSQVSLPWAQAQVISSSSWSVWLKNSPTLKHVSYSKFFYLKGWKQRMCVMFAWQRTNMINWLIKKWLGPAFYPMHLFIDWHLCVCLCVWEREWLPPPENGSLHDQHTNVFQFGLFQLLECTDIDAKCEI